jgi:hypothetical protein
VWNQQYANDGAGTPLRDRVFDGCPTAAGALSFLNATGTAVTS